RKDRLMSVPALCHLSLTLALGGDPAGAEREARAAVDLSGGSPRLYARAAGTLAYAQLEGGRGAEALAAAAHAKQTLAALGAIGEGDALVELAYVRALDAAGRGGEAAEALRAARERLLGLASRIQALEVRELFMTVVMENAALLAMARERLGG